MPQLIKASNTTIRIKPLHTSSKSHRRSRYKTQPRKNRYFPILTSIKRSLSSKECEQPFSCFENHKGSKDKTNVFKLTEVYKGIPIYGFEQAVAMKENKQVKSFFGKVHPQIKDVSITPSISEKKAIHAARRELEASIGKIEYLDGEPKGELYIYPHDGEYDLAYLVRLSTSEPEPGYWHYFIDAKTERSLSPLMPFMKRQVQESAYQVMKKALTSENKMGAFIWLTKQGEKGSIHLTRRT